ncbi:hypothetical protein [Micromonospora sp. CPCC 205561]|uniref:hypothetical protein n=1 Tax=Micromonospora sp. CPCC 205561 TaxID=3122407 RepID=UPI002FF37799
MTDEAIARQIGVGYRTVQRRTATLMSDLGASTRFLAAVQAAFRRLSSRPAGGGGPSPLDWRR